MDAQTVVVKTPVVIRIKKYAVTSGLLGSIKDHEVRQELKIAFGVHEDLIVSEAELMEIFLTAFQSLCDIVDNKITKKDKKAEKLWYGYIFLSGWINLSALLAVLLFQILFIFEVINPGVFLVSSLLSLAIAVLFYIESMDHYQLTNGGEKIDLVWVSIVLAACLSFMAFSNGPVTPLSLIIPMMPIMVYFILVISIPLIIRRYWIVERPAKRNREKVYHAILILDYFHELFRLEFEPGVHWERYTEYHDHLYKEFVRLMKNQEAGALADFNP
jgi:hypothetical protein